MSTSPDPPLLAGAKPSLWDWLRSDGKAAAVAQVWLASLVLNVLNAIPFVGALAEFLGDLGLEGVALVLAGSLLRRDGKSLRALVPILGLALVKLLVDAFNLIPEAGGVVDFAAEAGIDLAQLWLLKQVVTGSPAALPKALPEAVETASRPPR